MGAFVGRNIFVQGIVTSLIVLVASVAVCGAEDSARYIVRYKAGAVSGISAKSYSSAAASAAAKAERVLPLDNSIVVTLSSAQRDALATHPDVESLEVDKKIRAFFEPNDTSYPLQYGMQGTHGIGAPAAWNISAGAKTKLVAVVDSGVDFDHEDLQGSIWNNPGEIASNGLDDDGNGYVDDIRGYDFGSDVGDSDPTDENGHGTHVSGIIAATGNNALGVIGVAWRTNIIPVKCLDGMGNGYISYLVNALDYVSLLKDQGYPIAVVNMSLGTDEYSDALNRAVERVSARGILLVAAAGNNYGRNNDEVPSYPANTNSASVISVAASNEAGALASFSNYGPTTVDITAPGADILSTVPVALRGVPYDYIDGTSMAAPHVSGVAALVAAVNPTANAALIKSILLATVAPRSGLKKKTVSGGIVNAYSAVAVGVASNSRYRVTGTVTRRGKGVGRVAIALRLSSGMNYRRSVTTTSAGRFTFSDVPAGTYTLTPSRTGFKFTLTSRRVAVTSNKQVRFTAR
jgi:subtilisin family serine protease